MMAHELQRSRGRSAAVNARSRLFTARWKINPFEWKYASVLRFIAADRWFRCLENHGQSGEFHSNETPRCPITRSVHHFYAGLAASVGWRSLRHVNFPTVNFAHSNAVFFVQNTVLSRTVHRSLFLCRHSLTNVCFTSFIVRKFKAFKARSSVTPRLHNLYIKHF